MSMVKRGISNVSQPVQMVQDTFKQGDMVCEKCGVALVIASSTNGVIICPNQTCKHPNKVQDMGK